MRLYPQGDFKPSKLANVNVRVVVPISRENSRKEDEAMKRYILVAAVAAVTIQPLTPLPLPSGKTKGNRVANVVSRIATTGCAVSVVTEGVAVWNPPTVRSRDRGPL